jgi:PTS system fructose-specific IIC component
MKITDLLKKEGIALNVDAADQNAAIDKLIALHEAVGNLSNVSAFKEAILEREKKGSTAIGMGIAVPHGKSSAVSKAGVTAITIPSGIDYKSLDGNPSNLFFMIAAPDTAADTHLEVLSKLMTLLMDQKFAKKLVEAKTADEFLSIIDSKEAEKDKEEAAKKAAAAPAAPKAVKNIVGVTACPTGIAHTFMAAEALELKAKELGINIKVEKDGSGGAKDVLTAADIEAADAVIVACDKNIEMGRFNGKPVIITSTKEAIHSPEALLEKATSGNVAVYQHTGAVTKAADTTANESVGRKAYKHLMNGVSHMLPFVIGGGILIAIAFLLDDYSIDPSNFGSNTPIAAWFKTIGGADLDLCSLSWQVLLPRVLLIVQVLQLVLLADIWHLQVLLLLLQAAMFHQLSSALL